MVILEITEYIQFGGFNSKSLNLYLIERDAPLPEEKYKEVSNPLRQGISDYSAVHGEKVFENRIITYVFKAFKTEYRDRKVLEREIKRLVGPQLTTRIYDTHDAGFHWSGKCINVEVEDDEEYKHLIATLQFSCYPFMFYNTGYFTDDFRSFSFRDDIAAWTKFPVDGKRELRVFNQGERSVDVDIVVESSVPIVEKQEGTTTTQEVQVVTIPAKTHTVKAGDYLWDLAIKYGVTVMDIKKWNGITGEWAYPGDVLIVKPATTTTKVVNVETGTEEVVRSYFMKLTDRTGQVHYLNQGINYSQDINLTVGENIFTVEGQGTIAFHYLAEVMG